MPAVTAASQAPRRFTAAGPPCEQPVARLVDAATVPGVSGLHMLAICRVA
ncbi:hypothetical protein E1298_44600 [Actinomadura rubrisoli]|uniref:Uncharacterized protein n=1 Tax=Actinomadura rubrisoli TaxID=2530368 RepID=A0A4R4ZTM2_9ACTN|nr:hypothetical protein E1298_44600 [Actinomadura rubrisoli]